MEAHLLKQHTVKVPVQIIVQPLPLIVPVTERPCLAVMGAKVVGRGATVRPIEAVLIVMANLEATEVMGEVAWAEMEHPDTEVKADMDLTAVEEAMETKEDMEEAVAAEVTIQEAAEVDSAAAEAVALEAVAAEVASEIVEATAEAMVAAETKSFLTIKFTPLAFPPI